MKNLQILIVLISVLGCTNSQLSYLGQKPPGTSPELFAQAIVNTDSVELNGVFNNTFTEFFFTRIIKESFVIHHSELIDGNWTNPEPITLFAEENMISTAVDMSLTQDGKTMYFLGRNPKNKEGHVSLDIYVSNKINGKWQFASRVDDISTDEYTESYPTVVSDGSLYFLSNRPGGIGQRDVWRAQHLGNGKFDDPETVGPTINSESGSGDTFVAPDESFMVYSTSQNDLYGMYAAFKENGEWQTPIYLGEPINTDVTDFCPYMTPDNKYFFFSRRYSDPPESGWDGVTEGEVYWVDADVIFNLNKKQ